jgi:hypothetical protein
MDFARSSSINASRSYAFGGIEKDLATVMEMKGVYVSKQALV